jgi:hypothetical protein
VFVIKVKAEDLASVLYYEKRLTMGSVVLLLNPSAEGRWKELNVLSTNDPLIRMTHPPTDHTFLLSTSVANEKFGPFQVTLDHLNVQKVCVFNMK